MLHNEIPRLSRNIQAIFFRFQDIQEMSYFLKPDFIRRLFQPCWSKSVFPRHSSSPLLQVGVSVKMSEQRLKKLFRDFVFIDFLSF